MVEAKANNSAVIMDQQNMSAISLGKGGAQAY